MNISRPLGWALGGLLLALSCATRIPGTSPLQGSFPARADSLFLSPLSAEPGGGFVMEGKLEKSKGDAAGYLRVWEGFLAEECTKRQLTLVLPILRDSMDRAALAQGLDEAGWRRIYGAGPGPRARLLQVEGLRLVPVKRSFWSRMLGSLNLEDGSGREFGYVEMDYRLTDPRAGRGAAGRLVTRDPDGTWSSSLEDRAGRLMMKAGREAARIADPRPMP